MRNAPSMTGLRALDAVLRHGSLSGAAAELCITPAAISHRVRALETACGQPLLYRENGRFHATQVGLTVWDALGSAFENIRRADEIIYKNRGQTLTVSVSYSFGIMWLVPRLYDFEQTHPDVILYIQPSHDPMAMRGSDIVIAQLNTPPRTGDWTHLFDDVRTVMCRPQHPFAMSPPEDPAAILRAQLLHIAYRKSEMWGEYTWQQWASAMGLGPSRPVVETEVTAEHVAVEMLQHRDSLALITDVTVADHLNEGRLCALPGTRVKTNYSYWASAGTNTLRKTSPGQAFIHWLKAQLPPATA